jgi:hypothetical protein
MTRTARLFVLAALALVSLLGCSARIAVKELKPTDESVDGVPFRVKERYVLEVYQKTDAGYVKVGEQLATLPNPDRVYLLQHFGKAFANSGTKFKLRGDGTLETVALSSESTSADALAALGEQVDAIAEQAKALESAREEKDQAKEAARQATEQGEVDYVTAYNAAALAQAELDELPKDASASTRLAKENEVKLLKLQANIAARRADLPRPFPNVRP